MKFLVDIGNTRVKWACVEDGGVGRLHACRFGEVASAWRGSDVSSVVYCSVAPESVTSAVAAAWAGLPARRVRSSRACAGVHTLYTPPAALGDDRWASLLGARPMCPGEHVVIVDAGTAVTVDYLEAEGVHRGGAIMPGLAALRSGLTRTAPALPVEDGHARLPALATADGVAAGLWYGLAGGIERIMRELLASAGDMPRRCLLTGGDAVALRPFMTESWELVPALTLRGLLVAEEAGCAGLPSP